MGIIGVVSAMTVPTLMQSHQRKVYVTQLHKFYTELSQAAQRYITDHNAVNMREAGLNSQAALDSFFKTYFNIASDCKDESVPCFAPNSEYRNLSGTNIYSSRPAFITLTSGVSIGYGYTTGAGDRLCTLDVDINGAKGPNIAGRDVFIISLFNNGMVDDYHVVSAPGTREEREKAYNDYCLSPSYWTGCFGKILNDNWEMNY